MDADDDDYLRFQSRQFSLHGFSESRDFVIHSRSPYEKKRKDAIRANKKSLQLNIQSGSISQATKFSLPKCLAYRETGVTKRSNFKNEFLRLKLRQFKLVSNCQVDFADVSCYYVKGFKRDLIGAWTYNDYSVSATVMKSVTFGYSKPNSKSIDVQSSIADVICRDIVSLASYRVFDLCGLSYLDRDYVLYVANSYSRHKNIAHIAPIRASEYGDQQDGMVRRFEHHEILWSCAWNSYRQRFAIGADRCCYLHDYESFSKKIDLPRGQPYSLDFNSNGNMLYCGLHSGDLFGFDLRADTKMPSLTVPLCKNISYIKLLSNEQTIVASGFNSVLLNVDLRTRKSVFQYPNHHSLYKKLTFNLDESSDILCAPGEDNITRLWSVKEGKLLHSLPLPNRNHFGQINTHFEADGRKMYVHILLGETIRTFEALEESVQEQKVLRISAQPLF